MEPHKKILLVEAKVQTKSLITITIKSVSNSSKNSRCQRRKASFHRQ